MLILKIFGGIVVIISLTSLGLFKAKELENRVEQLKELICLFQLLETQISFMSNVLSEAFGNCARVFSDKPAAKIFEKFSCYIKDGHLADTAWKDAIENTRSALNLNNTDEKILISFGDSILNPDIEGQIKNIKFLIIQLTKQLELAEVEREKKKKLYMNLGILSGMAIVIVLM